MKYLLDSHTLLWSIFERSRLPRRTRRVLEDDSSELFVSVVSIWELAVKVGIGKLQLPGSSVRYVLEQIELIGLTLLPVKPDHVLRLEALPPHHKDPWDRMLIAQAFVEGLTLLSVDSKLALYNVPLLNT